MHPDLIAIIALWEADHALDKARHALAVNERAIAQAKATLARERERVRKLEATLAAQHAEEKEAQKGLDRYIQRRDTTHSRLEKGEIPDFIAAQRQLDQLAEIVGRLEDEQLERMMAREETEEALAAARKAAVDGEAALAQAGQRAESERPGLESSIAETTPVRDARRKELPHDLVRPYDGHRKLGQVPAARLKDGNCTACNVKAAPQMIIEVATGKRNHACRGCGRFLAPEKPEEPEA